MMRRALVVLVWCVWCSTAFAKGAVVELEYKQGLLHDVLRLLSETGHVNIVPLVSPETKIDAVYTRVPWDTVLADLVKRAKLASVREGSVILVGDRATIAARKKAKGRAYKGERVDIDFHEANGAAIAALLTKLGQPITMTGGTPLIRQRLARIPVDQAVDILALATGATSVPATVVPAQPGCVAPNRSWKKLRLAGIGRVGTTRYAVLVDGAEVAPIAMGDCVGSERWPVTDIGDSYVTFAGRSVEESSLSLHPASGAP